MSPREMPAQQRSLWWAIAISLIVHGLVLFAFVLQPPADGRPAKRIEASLAPRATPEPRPPVAPRPEAPSPAPTRRRVLAVDKPSPARPAPAVPKWSAAQKEEMNRFLDELAGQARSGPNLAQRSLAMAAAEGQRRAQRDEGEFEAVERIANSPPVDKFSLEMYLDGLVKKLNRSAAFVRNDPRAKGVKTAAVVVRLNPNGSLHSFRVMNAGDQQDEIAFIRAVVERAVPFAAFPADIGQSARSLALVICIRPAGGEGGFGFVREPGGRGC